MSSSDIDSGSADVETSAMNDDEPVMPSTSREGHSTMMMVDGQGNDIDGVKKRSHDTDEKCDKGAKRSRLTRPVLPRNGQNSQVFDDNEEYETDATVRNTLHGSVFQWKHMLLLLHRAREKKYRFRFATEMKPAEKFDDAVLEYWNPEKERVHRFLQFKHSSAGGMITVGDLLTTANKDPFGMVKYFNSWREIRNNPIFDTSKSKKFILCTNMGLDVEKLKDIKVTEIEVDDLLRVTKKPKQTPRFYKLKDEPSSLRNTLESKANASKEEISDFFEEFILAVNQPNEIELGEMIELELGAAHQFNLLDVDLIVDFFQNIVVKLLKAPGKNRKFLLNRDVDALFEELNSKLNCFFAIGLKSECFKRFKEYDIMFKVENSVLRKFLDSTDSLPNPPLIITSSNQTLLPALRVYRTVKESKRYKKMDSWIFICLEKLSLGNIADDVVLCAFESSKSYELLVIDCGSIYNNEPTQELWSRLRDILEKKRGKKLILIIRKNDSSALREIRRKRVDEIVIDDSITDLAEGSQQKLLEKKVLKFQGNDGKTSFKEIFGINGCDDIDPNELSALNKSIDEDTLIQLIRGEEIVIGSEIQGLGDVEQYYVPRTIVERVVIEAKILGDSNTRDLFAIGGIDQETLEKIVATENRNQSLDKSSLKKLDLDKYYILQSGREADHFRDICEQNPKYNIHWLQSESGELIWQQSFGSITELLAFRNTSMDHDNNIRPETTGLKEDQLAQHDEKRRIVILTDTAGMGKSTLLTHLAGEIKHNQSSLLVIEVNLTQRTPVLAKEQKEQTFEKDDTTGAVNFLVDKLSNLSTDSKRHILKEIVKVTGATAVLIDGFDEICPHYGDIVINLLRSLAKLPIKKLFVTTRPHASQVLERELGTFSYVLQPFDRENQMEFLTKFWGSELNSHDSDGTNKVELEEHASAVLKILSELINFQIQEFTGIPLQLKLVAEAFPFGKRKELKRSDSSGEPIYITDLYKRFIKKKFHIVHKEKSVGDDTNIVQKKQQNKLYLSFLTTHQKLALEALFDAETVTALMKCQPDIDEMSSSSQDEEDDGEGEERSGIVTQIIDGKPHFVHRTYAEYFTAAFLSKKLKHNGCDLQVQKFFVRKFLIDQEYGTIRAFLNCLLCREDHAPEKYSWAFDDSRKHCNFPRETWYHVAARECNTGIVRFFSIRLGISPAAALPKQDPNINVRNLFMETPLLIAVKKHVLALVKLLVERGADINRESKDGSTALHCALESKAEINMVKYLVENGAEINHESKNGSTALHYALEHKAEINVVKYLVENGAEINRESRYGSTALHSALWHKAGINIVKYLVENGAEINRESRYGSTALHSALEHKAEINVVKYLVENGAEINRESRYGSTALQSALEHKAEINIVKYLVENGAEINRESRYGSTALQSALKHKAEINIVKYLVENGAEINRESRYGSTALQSALKHKAEINIVKYLVENGAEINRESKTGLTALHRAVLCGRDGLDIIKYLVENGAEINRVSKLDFTHGDIAETDMYLVENGAEINRESMNGSTALHWAVLCVRDRLDIIKYLVENGAEINRESKDGSTALHWAVLCGRDALDIIKYLVENGAEINRESKDGSTALHRASLYRGLDIIRYLVENGAEINRESKDGSTALHRAIRCGRDALDIIKYLVENGAEINRESKDGLTALHRAVLCGRYRLDIMKYLVENGAEINRESKDGSTALHWAVLCGRDALDIIKYLVENGAEINRESKDGSTALHRASLYRGLDIIRYLVENGAEINRESKDGSTALHRAILCGRDALDIIKYLVENGAEINRESKDGLTALHRAVLCGRYRLDIMKYLVENGAEINRESKDGSTALHCALGIKAQINVVKYLVENGAEINHESKDGSTALHCALGIIAEINVVKYLVENGAEINHESKDGSTALHRAVLCGCDGLDIIKYLVENGAEINRESKDGSTALHRAFLYRSDRLDIIRYLVENGAEIKTFRVDKTKSGTR